MNTDLVFFDDLRELSKYAELLDTDVYIIAKNFKSQNEVSELREKIKKQISGRCMFEICHVVEKPNPNELRKFKQSADFVAAIGGTAEMNGFAAVHKEIDFLMQPCNAEKFSFDTAIARGLAERNTAVAFPFSQFLNARPKERSLIFKNYIFAAKIMRKFKVNALFFSCAGNKWDLRCAKDFSAFAALFGFSEAQGKYFTGSFAENFLMQK